MSRSLARVRGMPNRATHLRPLEREPRIRPLARLNTPHLRLACPPPCEPRAIGPHACGPWRNTRPRFCAKFINPAFAIHRQGPRCYIVARHNAPKPQQSKAAIASLSCPVAACKVPKARAI